MTIFIVVKQPIQVTSASVNLKSSKSFFLCGL